MRKNPKVILLGYTNVGKTSILEVLINKSYQYRPNTLGACFHRYEMNDDGKEGMIMDLWDTAGQEKFRSLLTLYYKSCDAVVIVFDLTSPKSFQTVDYWANQIEQNCDSNPIIVLVGNKSDLKSSSYGVNQDDIQKYLAKKTGWKYVVCSARTNYNVEKIFKTVCQTLREKDRAKQTKISNYKISQLAKQRSRYSNCC